MIITCHGVAETNPDYANKLVKNLPGHKIVQLFWGDIPSLLENEILTDDQKTAAWKQMGLRDLRPTINQFVGDAMAWFNPLLREEIKERLFSQLPPVEPTILLLHSWANCILWDLLSDSEFAKCLNIQKIITAGCPLLIYEILIKNTHSLATMPPWTNFYHPLDLIASPLGGFVTGDITDIKINDPPWDIFGDLGVILAGQAHTSYWASKQVADACKDF